MAQMPDKQKLLSKHHKISLFGPRKMICEGSITSQQHRHHYLFEVMSLQSELSSLGSILHLFGATVKFSHSHVVSTSHSAQTRECDPSI